jgi:hypothetical protein
VERWGLGSRKQSRQLQLGSITLGRGEGLTFPTTIVLISNLATNTVLQATLFTRTETPTLHFPLGPKLSIQVAAIAPAQRKQSCAYSYEVIWKVAIYFGMSVNDLKYVIVIYIEGTTRMYPSAPKFKTIAFADDALRLDRDFAIPSKNPQYGPSQIARTQTVDPMI